MKISGKAWVKKSMFPMAMAAGLICLDGATNQGLAQNQSPSPTTNANAGATNAAADKAKPAQRNSPLRFEPKETFYALTPKTIQPGTFYYSNAQSDGTAVPVVGEEDGLRFVTISSLDKGMNKIEASGATLKRWVKIPANAPKEITVSFKTKTTRNPDYDWGTISPGGGATRRASVAVVFLRGDGLRGGGITLTGSSLTKTLDTWREHTYTIPVPKGAELLELSIRVAGGYSVSLGGWSIK
jgi:hypothetical protein